MRTQTVPAIAPGNRSWVLAAALGVSVCAGCDGNTGVGGGGAGGAGGAGGDTGSGGEAGFSPHLLPWEGGDATLAFRSLDFGDVGPDGAPSPTGWAKVGLDLDGKSSTAGSTDLCKPATGADAEKVLPDGEGGVDNSFGKDVLPVLAAVAPGFTQSTNALIEGGFYSMVGSIGGLASRSTFPTCSPPGGIVKKVPPSFTVTMTMPK